MKMTKEEVLLLTQPAVAGLLSKKEARIAALEDWLREGIAIVIAGCARDPELTKEWAQKAAEVLWGEVPRELL